MRIAFILILTIGLAGCSRLYVGGGERGTLPVAAARLRGEVSEPARLARIVLDGGPDASAAVREAVLRSGFGLRERNGQVVGAGPEFDVSEVEALGAGAHSGLSTTMEDFARVIAALIPGTPVADIALAISEDVQTDLRSSDPQTRFFGSFVNALSDNGALGAEINVLQAAMIAERLAGDIFLVDRTTRGRAGDERRFATASLLNAEYTRLLSHPLVAKTAYLTQLAEATTIVQNSRLPGCDWEQHTPEWVSAVSKQLLPASSKLFWSQLLKAYQERVINADPNSYEFTTAARELERANNIKLGISAGNVLLFYAKTLATLAFADISISMSDPPLVRVRGPQRGKRTELTTRVWMEPGNWAFVNCLSDALSVAGVKAVAPKPGPLGGAIVQWRLVTGGAVQRDAARGAAFFRPQAPLVEFEVTPDGTNVTGSVTGANGQARIGVWGAARARAMPADARPVDRQFEVEVRVALAPITLQKFLAEIPSDVVNPVGAILKLPAKLMLSSRWASNRRRHVFPVRDLEKNPAYTFRIEAAASCCNRAGGDFAGTNAGDVHIEGALLPSETVQAEKPPFEYEGIFTATFNGATNVSNPRAGYYCRTRWTGVVSGQVFANRIITPDGKTSLDVALIGEPSSATPTTSASDRGTDWLTYSGERCVLWADHVLASFMLTRFRMSLGRDGRITPQDLGGEGPISPFIPLLNFEAHYDLEAAEAPN